MKKNDRLDTHLAVLLEGYEANRSQVEQFITNTEEQLNGARANLQETEGKISDLKDLMGLGEEESMEASE
jgi:hypothetical protein